MDIVHSLQHQQRCKYQVHTPCTLMCMLHLQTPACQSFTICQSFTTLPIIHHPVNHSPACQSFSSLSIIHHPVNHSPPCQLFTSLSIIHHPVNHSAACQSFTSLPIIQFKYFAHSDAYATPADTSQLSCDGFHYTALTILNSLANFSNTSLPHFQILAQNFSV